MKINLKTKYVEVYCTVRPSYGGYSVCKDRYYIQKNSETDDRFEDIAFQVTGLSNGYIDLLYPDQMTGIIEGKDIGFWRDFRPCTPEEIKRFKSIEDEYKVKD